ncbi:MAG: trans-2-enoyl-CoA reductase family protein [Spirochaetaceae bacterium]|jgi:enoyl-[acyl-carrier protein] reductase/trans-2-enoyl-CoA reductase (NAD+)|nr:trans-2-enoyl-CoA reductase family protein [Spirochaetaceae bacterium]
MIIKPMVRNNICINSHPSGCAKTVKNCIDYAVKNIAGGKKGKEAGKAAPQGAPRLILVIGCSTGYGLSSRIAAAFGYGAASVGISFEKPGSATKPGTPGWYNNRCFDSEAKKAGLASLTLDGDAFSDEIKEQAVKALTELAAKEGLKPQVDLIIYSLASPVRTDPDDGVMYRSVIKPIGKNYSGLSVDMMSGKLGPANAEPASDEEIAHTIKVMGGEDWERWITALDKAGVLAPNARTVAYTYLGPELSWAIYKNGTIGRAKADLERAAAAINQILKSRGGAAWVSVNKALVTRASAVIPIIPLYVSTLFKVMKEMGLHEGCIEQITRLYKERLYTEGAALDPAKVPVDEAGRIRIDDWEMREDVQKETTKRMESVTEENIYEKTDLAGFKHDFLEAHGFDVAGVDYEADVDPSGIDL